MQEKSEISVEEVSTCECGLADGHKGAHRLAWNPPTVYTVETRGYGYVTREQIVAESEQDAIEAGMKRHGVSVTATISNPTLYEDRHGNLVPVIF